MKKLLFSLIVGLIPFYLLNIAFHINVFDIEMFLHILVRFIAGFLIFGIWVWYWHKLKVKYAIVIIVFLFLTDIVFDYFRNVYNFNFEMLIYDFYTMIWGSISGFIFIKYLNKKA
jgi:hypothetical protein